MTRPSDRDVILDVPVVFDVADGTLIHSPMVHAVVGGVESRLILDTGSTDHVLTTTLIDLAGAPTAPADDGTDHAGAAVPSWSVGELDVSIAGRGFGLRDVVAIASPGPFDGWGVGGFLSPQHLHPRGLVLIDLVADRLVVADLEGRDPAVVRAALVARVPDHRPVTLPRTPGEATVAIEAAVDGFEPVATMLNTGGRGTEFARRAAARLPTSDVRQGSAGVSGAGVMGAEAGPHHVLVGDIRVPVARLVLRDEMDDPPGIIGMDVLRGTAIICTGDPAEPVTWLVPASLRTA